MRIVCLSDTHGLHETLCVPQADVLIHAGDCTAKGTAREVEAFDRWLSTLPHRTKLVIPGNHDLTMLSRRRLKNAEILRPTGMTVDGIKFGGCLALTRPLQKKFDVFVTHYRPASELLQPPPRVVIHGHTSQSVQNLQTNRCIFIPASVTHHLQIVRPPTLLEITPTSIRINGQHPFFPVSGLAPILVFWQKGHPPKFSKLLETDALAREIFQAVDDPKLKASADYVAQAERYSCKQPDSSTLRRCLSQEESARLWKHPFWYTGAIHIARRTATACVELCIYDWLDPLSPPDDGCPFYSPPRFFARAPN